MIELSFSKPNKSILTLAKVKLPDFTVITGVNGSGKSQLLEAIKTGAITVEGIQPNDADIRLFNWTNLVPSESNAADPIAISRERASFIEKASTVFAQARKNYIDSLASLGVSFLPLSDVSETLKLDQAKVIQLQKEASEPRNFWPHIDAARRNGIKICQRNLGAHQVIFVALTERAEELGIPLFALTPEQLERAIPLHWLATDLFQQNFSQIFASYYRLAEENRYNEYANQFHNEKNAILSDEAFRKTYGNPPWDFVNRLLEEARLNFTINKPSGRAELPFEAKLITKNTKQEVSFRDLSSGEKIIMSFALCLYNASDRSRRARYPKLLLFDEIDAPLHPTMTKDLLRVVQRVLVQENQVKVIMTTHSPATVALSPDGSLFKLKNAPHVLEPCTREQAVQSLTSGYISVTESSRFVIVEAMFDRKVYSAMARKLVVLGKLAATPNIVFIQATDKKDKEGGGKSQVKNWASKLPESGLDQILGLIDRDAANAKTGNVYVIGRYSLENYLCDPIVLFAYLVHEGVHAKICDEPIPDSNYFILQDKPEDTLQKIADSICRIIEKHSPEVKAVGGGSFSEKYLNGKTLTLPLWVRDFRGHDLVTACRKAFQKEIRSDFIITANDCDGLVDILVERLPGFIPLELAVLLEEMQTSA